MSRHAPTPWVALADPCHFDTLSDIYADGKLVAQTCTGYPELEDNAAFIVKAVNAHDELVAALKNSLDWLASYQGGGAIKAYEQSLNALVKAGAL